MNHLIVQKGTVLKTTHKNPFPLKQREISIFSVRPQISTCLLNILSIRPLLRIGLHIKKRDPSTYFQQTIFLTSSSQKRAASHPRPQTPNCYSLNKDRQVMGCSCVNKGKQTLKCFENVSSEILFLMRPEYSFTLINFQVKQIPNSASSATITDKMFSFSELLLHVLNTCH